VGEGEGRERGGRGGERREGARRGKKRRKRKGGKGRGESAEERGRRREEERSGEGAADPARAPLRRSAALSPAAMVHGFRALPQLRAPLHNKIYFKTQLKETGRLHVTV
jgi:hypothetical protein